MSVNPIDPILERDLRRRPSVRSLATACADQPTIMAAKYQELLYGLRRLAFDPSIENVHHARNVARVQLEAGREWIDEDEERWKDQWNRPG